MPIPAMPLLASVSAEMGDRPRVCMDPLDALQLNRWIREVKRWQAEYTVRCDPPPFDESIEIEPWGDD